MSTLRLTVVAALALQAALLSDNGRLPQEPAQGRVRVSVEVIPVDVQVIDREGHPVAGLGPEQFTVTINGRRHRVVSAEFIESRTASTSPGAPQDQGLTAANPTPADLVRGRVIVLAVDSLSFRPSDMPPAIAAARDFIARLAPDVLVGLFAYPIGPEVEPTLDRAAVLRALEGVIG